MFSVDLLINLRNCEIISQVTQSPYRGHHDIENFKKSLQIIAVEIQVGCGNFELNKR